MARKKQVRCFCCLSELGRPKAVGCEQCYPKICPVCLFCATHCSCGLVMGKLLAIERPKGTVAQLEPFYAAIHMAREAAQKEGTGNPNYVNALRLLFDLEPRAALEPQHQ